MSREKPAASARRGRKQAFMAALDERSERYGRQAEALAAILELEYGDPHEGADIGELCDRPLSRGVLHHLRQLFEHADFLDPRTVRRFYVELRMWGDYMAAERGDCFPAEWGRSTGRCATTSSTRRRSPSSSSSAGWTPSIPH